MDFSKLIAYLDDFLRAEQGVPGCEIKVMQRHKCLLRYSSGTADYEGQRPIGPDTLYFLYSCTKVTTCTAALQLVEQGILELDAPVSRYLPEFGNVCVLRYGQKAPASCVMTVRHLFTMSAGLDYNLQSPSILETISKNPHSSTRELVAAMAKEPLHFEPGERFQYSLCHDVLAAVVEAVSGMKFSEYLKKNIWEPLGMKRTGFVIPAQERKNLAAQFIYRDTLQPMEQVNEFVLSDAYESGGAGLYSCVEDYSLLADALANSGTGITGKQILKPETIDLMRSEQLSRFIINSSFSCTCGLGYGYGLGVRTLINKEHGQRSSIGEFGWDGAAGSYLLADPAHGLSIFFAMHIREWPLLLGEVHKPIRDLTYEALSL